MLKMFIVILKDKDKEENNFILKKDPYHHQEKQMLFSSRLNLAAGLYT